MDEASQSWGKKLVGALTEEQIERLLDVVTSTGALEKLDEPLRAIDPDLAQTVPVLLNPADTAPVASPQAAVSDQKALETWNELWGKWESHVLEVGDERGQLRSSRRNGTRPLSTRPLSRMTWRKSRSPVPRVAGPRLPAGQ